MKRNLITWIVLAIVLNFIFIFPVSAQSKLDNITLGFSPNDIGVLSSSNMLITTTEIPDGQHSKAYDFQFEVDNATGNVQWEITDGDLPLGIVLSHDGRLSGTTSAANIFYISVTATDSLETVEKEFVFRIFPPDHIPEFRTLVLNDGKVGQEYSQIIVVWAYPFANITKIEGDLPPGLYLNTKGVLIGNPTQGGNYIFTILAENSLGKTKHTYDIFISGPEKPPSITVPDKIPLGKVGETYSLTLVSNIYPAPTWSIVAGTLPNGVVLTSYGDITGVPTESGIFQITIKAKNTNGVLDTIDLKIIVVPAGETEPPSPPSSQSVTGGSSSSAGSSNIDKSLNTFFENFSGQKNLTGIIKKQEATITTNNALNTTNNKTSNLVVRYINREGITVEALRTTANIGIKNNSSIRIYADTVIDKSVISRLTIDPANTPNLTTDTKFGIYTSSNDALHYTRYFEEISSNKIAVAVFDHRGSFGMPVNVAVKLNFSSMDIDNLHIYAYNISANTITKISSDSAWIDKNGYFHYTTTVGDVLIVSEGAIY